MSTDPDRRVVVVTGANRGLGHEIARRCAARGDDVVLGSRDPEAGRAAAERIRQDTGATDVTALDLDVTDAPRLAAAAERVRARTGRVDVLINNAGAHYDPDESSAAPDLAAVRDALEVNLLGPWRTTLAFLPLLRAGAHPRVVMVSSEVGSLASMRGGAPAYRVSKAGLNALTRTLAADLAADRILVNAVSPGWLATSMGGPGGRPVGDGAASILWGADLPDDGPTGTFTRDGQEVPW